MSADAKLSRSLQCLEMPTVESVLRGATKIHVDAPLHERKEIERAIRSELPALSFVSPADADVVIRIVGRADESITTAMPTT